jgi:hypothetical protein
MEVTKMVYQKIKKEIDDVAGGKKNKPAWVDDRNWARTELGLADAAKKDAWLASPGGKLMHDYSGRMLPEGHAEMTEDKLKAFREVFKFYWQWSGSTSTPPPGEVLDGEKRAGNCRSLSRALRILAASPRTLSVSPVESIHLGLGLEPRLFTETDYSGEHDEGFVAEHSAGDGLGVFGLEPNVIGNGGSPLYFWGSHQVMKYGGRYWDPSYGRVYNSLSEMALFTIVKERTKNGVTNCEARSRRGETVYFKKVFEPWNGTTRVRYHGPSAKPSN